MNQLRSKLMLSRGLSNTAQKCVKNAFGVPLIPPNLHEQLFAQPQVQVKIDDTLKKEALDHLSSFQIHADKPSGDAAVVKPHIAGALPDLKGNVESHFYNIAQEQIEPYVKAAESLKTFPTRFPKSWAFTPGWTKYSKDGKAHAVSVPDADALVFDIELCVKEGPWPLMAAALSKDAWYSWCSPYLINPSLKPMNPSCLDQDDMIPIGDPTLVIGHNVSFDRARIADQYNLKLGQTRFLDTMALHIAVGGMTSSQRMFKAAEKAGNPLLNNSSPKWIGETSMNGLNDVHKFYLPNEKRLEKDIRDTFVTGSIQDVIDDFQKLMNYCANDVKATLQVFNEIFPLFRARCPHPVTLSGMLTMSVAYLPVQPSWFQYIEECENVALELDQEIEILIARQASEACQLLHGKSYKEDVWLWDLDWTCAPMKVKKATKKALINPLVSNAKDSELEKLGKKFYPLLNRISDLYKTQPRCPGYPKWYSELCEPYDHAITPKPGSLGYSKAIVPKLLRLTWLGYPLHKDEKKKWGYLVPHEDVQIFQDLLEMNDDDQEDKFPLANYVSMMEKSLKIAPGFDGDSSSIDFVSEPPDFHALGGPKAKKPHSEIGYELENVPGCVFHQLPHKDGQGLAVGNPLGKAFLDKIQAGVLSTYADNPEDSGHLAEKVLKVSKMMSYWKSSRDRIQNQIVVKAKDGSMAIAPQVVTAGTVTRRAVEKTWLTASNAKEDRVGSELKAMVVAPDGFSLVGADVDSQELWIAAVIGDAHFTGEHGSTALGWMTLQGNKNDCTDMHSVVAKTVGVTRNEAKVLNYGRIYGAGVKFASQLLRNFNPKLSDSESVALANKMYKETKGDRKYVLNSVGMLCYSLYFGTKEDLKKRLTVDKTKVSKCMNEKRKLDLILEDVKPKLNSTFELSEAGMEIAENFDIPYDRDTHEITFENLQLISQQMGPVRNTLTTQEYLDLRNKVTQKSVWFGGSESHTFNKLEDIALTWQAKTPILGCSVSRALESKVVGGDYLPSRINWVVQSSAVDYLHLLLSSMQWLMGSYNIEGRFVISIHDEVRYLVPEKDAYRAGLALQFANLLVRAMFCSRLNMNSMPMDVAFFSGVDIDKVMRKEPTADCVTPSNPQGLFHGYGIPPGECLTIEDLIRKTGGSLG